MFERKSIFPQKLIIHLQFFTIYLILKKNLNSNSRKASILWKNSINGSIGYIFLFYWLVLIFKIFSYPPVLLTLDIIFYKRETEKNGYQTMRHDDDLFKWPVVNHNMSSYLTRIIIINNHAFAGTSHICFYEKLSIPFWNITVYKLYLVNEIPYEYISF